MALVLPLFFAEASVGFAAEEPANSRLERLNLRNAKIRSRLIRNSRASTNFGFGSRKSGLNDIRNTQSIRRKTYREYKLLTNRPSRRKLHQDPVNRSRPERVKSANAYNERLKRGLSSCSKRFRSRYDRNNCIRKITRGTRTFE